MAKVIDLRSYGGDLVLIGRNLVLPASSEEIEVGAEPMVGSIRYNFETGAPEFYVRVDANLQWEKVVLGRDLDDLVRRDGDKMLGDLAFEEGTRLLLADGDTTAPSLAFENHPTTGLAVEESGNLAVVVNGSKIAEVRQDTFAVLGTLLADALNITNFNADSINANTLTVSQTTSLGETFATFVDADVLRADVATLLDATAETFAADALTANAANVTILVANTANVVGLRANAANVADFAANAANVVALASNAATIANLAAQAANVVSLAANAANVASLTGNVGNIADLTAHVIQVVPATPAPNYVSVLDLGTAGALWQVTHETDHSLTFNYQGNTAVTLYANGTVAGEYFSGSAASVGGADLAERYEADAIYEPGTVVVIGGLVEITIARNFADPRVAGVISTAPGLRMNDRAGPSTTHPLVALKGRIPCKVIGPIAKGDLLVTSATPGHAQAIGSAEVSPAAILGRALQDFPGSGTGTIEIKV